MKTIAKNTYRHFIKKCNNTQLVFLEERVYNLQVWILHTYPNNYKFCTKQ